MITGARGAVPAGGQLGRDGPGRIGPEVGPGAVERELARLDQLDHAPALGPDGRLVVDPVVLGKGRGARRTRPRPSSASAGPAGHDSPGPGRRCRRRTAAPSSQRTAGSSRLTYQSRNAPSSVEAEPHRVRGARRDAASARRPAQVLRCSRFGVRQPLAERHLAEAAAVGRADVEVARCRRPSRASSPRSSSATTRPGPDPASRPPCMKCRGAGPARPGANRIGSARGSVRPGQDRRSGPARPRSRAPSRRRGSGSAR